MSEDSTEVAPPARRSYVMEILARFLRADYEERNRLAKDYPVLFSATGLHWLIQLEANFQDRTSPHVEAGINFLKRGGVVDTLLADESSHTDVSYPSRFRSREQLRLKNGDSIDQYPVTNAEYARFLTKSSYPPSTIAPQFAFTGEDDPDARDLMESVLKQVGVRGFHMKKAQEKPDAPVVEVSWFDAVEYARWERKNIPPAKAWEDAISGGPLKRMSKGLNSIIARYLHKTQTTRETAGVYEWTSTLSKHQPFPILLYEIRGGSRRNNDQDDLWNELGFRCYRPVPQFSRQQLIEEVEHAEIERQMRVNLGFDEEDGTELVGIREIAEAIASGRVALDEVCDHVVEHFLQQGHDAASRVVKECCKFVRRRTEHVPRSPISPQVVSALAKLGLSIAEALQDEALHYGAVWSVGQALLFRRDDEGAKAALEECLAYFEKNNDKPMLARCHLNLGLASLVGDLMIGAEKVGSKDALEHFTEAYRLFEQLSLEIEMQWAQCCMANAFVRLGDAEGAFLLGRRALAHSAFFAHPRDEVVGILRAAEMLLNGKRYAHAAYAYRTAHALASALGDLELITESRLHLFLCFSETDLSEAARECAKAFECSTWIRTGTIMRVINSIGSFGQDDELGTIVSNYLAVLTNAADELKFPLPILELSEIACMRCFYPGTSLRERWLAIESGLPTQLTSTEGMIVSLARGIALLAEEGAIAQEAATDAVKQAIDTNRPESVTIAKMMYLRVLLGLGNWQDALQTLSGILKDLNDRLGSMRSLSFAGYESKIWYSAGLVSKTLEAADEASIEGVRCLDAVSASNLIGQLHLLRSLLYSALGSPKSFAEAFAAEAYFNRSSNGPELIACYLREGQALIEQADFEHAARRFEQARVMLASPHARKQPRLIAEFDYSIAMLHYAAGQLETADLEFQRSAATIERLSLPDDSVGVLSKLAALKAQMGDNAKSGELLSRLLPLARQRGRPFELIDILTVAAHVRRTEGDLPLAERYLREAIEWYWKVRGSIESDPSLRKTWLVRHHHLFADLIHRVLLPQGKTQEALAVLQQTKTSWLQDMLQESHYAFGARENTDELRALWLKLRSLEDKLETESQYFGAEQEEAALRIELSTVRQQFRAIAGVVDKTPAYEMVSETIWRYINVSATAVLDFSISDRGADVFVLLPGERKIRSVSLDIASLWESGLLKERTDAHSEEVLGLLWTLLFRSSESANRLLSMLEQSGTRRLIFIPSDRLNLLPLHAAKDQQHGKYLLDSFDAVSFAPSLQILSLCLNRPRPPMARLLAVSDPSGTLKSAPMETDFIRGLFQYSDILHGEEATPEKVASASDNVDVLHFSCHGHFDPQNPLNSGIRLSKGDLKLAEVYNGTILSKGALVSVASCESGVFDSRYTNEFVGFPAAFLYAGASAVVGGLWKVDDVSTALLMRKYYSNLMLDTNTAAEALNRAQKWLRDSTAAELGLASLYADQYESSQRTDVAAFRAMRHFQSQPNIKPFLRPFFWAGFVLYGATSGDAL